MGDWHFCNSPLFGVEKRSGDGRLLQLGLCVRSLFSNSLQRDGGIEEGKEWKETDIGHGDDTYIYTYTTYRIGYCIGIFWKDS